MSEFYKTNDGKIIKATRDEYFSESDLKEMAGITIPSGGYSEYEKWDGLYEALSGEAQKKLDDRVYDAVINKYDFREDDSQYRFYEAYDKETGELVFESGRGDLDEAVRDFMSDELDYPSSMSDIIEKLGLKTDDLFIYAEVNTQEGKAFAFMEADDVAEHYGNELKDMSESEIEKARQTIKDNSQMYLDGNAYTIDTYDEQGIKSGEVQSDFEWEESTYGVFAYSEESAIKTCYNDVEYIGTFDSLEDYIENTQSLDAKITAAEEKAAGSNEDKETKAHDDMEL